MERPGIVSQSVSQETSFLSFRSFLVISKDEKGLKGLNGLLAID
jgi:hypothetical protein